MQQSATPCENTRFHTRDHRLPTHDSDTRRILAAAWQVLERSRFRSLKVRQVLAASNTSASNFYRRFPSKAHLLLALLEEEVVLVDSRLRDRIDAEAPVSDQLHCWVEFILGNLDNRARAQRTRLFLDQELMEVLPDRVTTLYGILDRQLSEIIRHGMRRGELPLGDPDSSAMLVGHLIRGLLTSGVNGGLPSDEPDLVARVHTFVLHALGHR